MGAGFKIALRDLELRGAGNLLGTEQSGHVAGVGFEMYCQLLRESVSRLKGEESSLPASLVRLDFLHSHESPEELPDAKSHPSFIPEYINEPRLRIECYRKLAKIIEIEQLNEFEMEMVDRFGSIPPAMEALLKETLIRCLAQQAGFLILLKQKGQIYFAGKLKVGKMHLQVF